MAEAHSPLVSPNGDAVLRLSYERLYDDWVTMFTVSDFPDSIKGPMYFFNLGVGRALVFWDLNNNIWALDSDSEIHFFSHGGDGWIQSIADRDHLPKDVAGFIASHTTGTSQENEPRGAGR